MPVQLLQGPSPQELALRQQQMAIEQKQADDPLNKILKGLNIASTILGGAVNVSTLMTQSGQRETNDFKLQEAKDAKADADAGIITKSQLADLEDKKFMTLPANATDEQKAQALSFKLKTAQPGVFETVQVLKQNPKNLAIVPTQKFNAVTGQMENVNQLMDMSSPENAGKIIAAQSKERGPVPKSIPKDLIDPKTGIAYGGSMDETGTYHDAQGNVVQNPVLALPKTDKDKTTADTSTLYNEYNNHDTTKHTAAALNGLSKIQDYKGIPYDKLGAGGIMAIIDSAVQVQNPGVVRQGTINSIADMKNLPDATQSFLSRFFGEGFNKIGPDQIASLISATEKTADTRLKQQDAVNNQFANRAKKLGVDPSDVLDPNIVSAVADYKARKANPVAGTSNGPDKQPSQDPKDQQTYKDYLKMAPDDPHKAMFEQYLRSKNFNIPTTSPAQNAVPVQNHSQGFQLLSPSTWFGG